MDAIIDQTLKKQAMSADQLKAFQNAVASDKSLESKLREASNANDVVQLAKSAGFTIDASDLTSAQSELSDEMLELASGGTTPTLTVAYTPAVIISASVIK